MLVRNIRKLFVIFFMVCFLFSFSFNDVYALNGMSRPNVKASSVTYNRVKIYWNNVKSAKGYAVYKYNIDNKAYKYTTKDFGYAKAFGKTISLKYDSKHPDKAVAVSSKNYLVYLVIGLILIIINSLIYIFVRKSILRAIQTVTDLLTRNVEED